MNLAFSLPDVTSLVQAISSGLAIGSIYALIALGFSFVFASTRVVNFAQGDWAMVAGMACSAIAATQLGLLGAAIAAPILGALLGFGVFRLFVGPARSADVITVSLILLGLSFILEGGAAWLWGVDYVTIPALASLPPLHLGSAVVAQMTIVITLSTIALLVGVVSFLRFTKLGRAMIATSSNPEAAALCGINVRRVIMLSFILSGILAGFAGLLVTPVTSMGFLTGQPLTLKAFAAAAIGGLRDPWASVAGGFALGLLEALSATYLSGGAWGQISGLVLALIILVVVGPRIRPNRGGPDASESLDLEVADDLAHL